MSAVYSILVKRSTFLHCMRSVWCLFLILLKYNTSTSFASIFCRRTGNQPYISLQGGPASRGFYSLWFLVLGSSEKCDKVNFDNLSALKIAQRCKSDKRTLNYCVLRYNMQNNTLFEKFGRSVHWTTCIYNAKIEFAIFVIILNRPAACIFATLQFAGKIETKLLLHKLKSHGWNGICRSNLVALAE